MAYNSQYTGAQIDEAIGDVRGNKAAWSGKQDVLLDSGAKVGDLIKVKAVDASGKPGVGAMRARAGRRGSRSSRACARATPPCPSSTA